MKTPDLRTMEISQRVDNYDETRAELVARKLEVVNAPSSNML